MRALCVDAGNEQAHAVGSPAVLLRVGLGTVCDAGGDLGEGDGAVVGEAGCEGLLLHEVGEDTGVGGETGEGEAIVRVDGDDLLLVG